MMVPFMVAYWLTIFFSFWIGLVLFSVAMHKGGRAARIMIGVTVTYYILWAVALFLGFWLPVFIPGLY